MLQFGYYKYEYFDNKKIIIDMDIQKNVHYTNYDIELNISKNEHWFE